MKKSKLKECPCCGHIYKGVMCFHCYWVDEDAVEEFKKEKNIIESYSTF